MGVFSMFWIRYGIFTAFSVLCIFDEQFDFLVNLTQGFFSNLFIEKNQNLR